MPDSPSVNKPTLMYAITALLTVVSTMALYILNDKIAQVEEAKKDLIECKDSRDDEREEYMDLFKECK